MSPTLVRQAVGLATGKVFAVDASHIAIEELGRDITNAPMLGAFARATGILAIEDLIERLRTWFGRRISPQMVEANVRALQRAAAEMQQG
jgi:pyruvate ferredoxin oxidoreductase gamma subunit